MATVKTYVSRILAKLGARDRVQLVIAAYEAARKQGRERRRLIHKSARARPRVALAAVRATCDDASVVFRDGRRRSELKWMVLDRRAADNVGALTRWAAARPMWDSRRARRAIT